MIDLLALFWLAPVFGLICGAVVAWGGDIETSFLKCWTVVVVISTLYSALAAYLLLVTGSRPLETHLLIGLILFGAADGVLAWIGLIIGRVIVGLTSIAFLVKHMPRDP